MRIQKYLSQQNILSRREAERFIEKGWVTLNGELVRELGTKMDPETDEVGFIKPLEELLDERVYLAVYKPRGVVTNLPERGEKEIVDILPSKYRGLSSVGRLDKDSEGLILMSNDGVFAKQCLDDVDPHVRVYEVLIHAEITDAQIKQLERGIFILGEPTRGVEISRIGERKIEIRMWEGKNRQIRRMFKHVGLVVQGLRRVRFGEVELGDLKSGEFRVLELA